MKHLLLIILIAISTISNAQSTRERLDDFEWELEKQRVEREGREFDRKMDELRRLREKNRDSPYMVLSDGTVINVDEHIRNRKNICYLTWTGNQFIKGLPSYKSFIEIHFDTIPNIIFIPKSNEVDIAKIIKKNKNIMEKICPNLKTNSEFLAFFK